MRIVAYCVRSSLRLRLRIKISSKNRMFLRYVDSGASVE